MPASVHVADARLLATEKRDLRAHRDGLPGAAPLSVRIEPWSPEPAPVAPPVLTDPDLDDPRAGDPEPLGAVLDEMRFEGGSP